MNKVTKVNVLNRDVKFTYEDGSQRMLNESGAKSFFDYVEASREAPIDFATPQRRLVYVANRYFGCGR